VFKTRKHLASAFDASDLVLSCYNSVRACTSTQRDTLRLSFKINFFYNYKLGDHEHKSLTSYILRERSSNLDRMLRCRIKRDINVFI